MTDSESLSSNSLPDLVEAGDSMDPSKAIEEMAPEGDGIEEMPSNGSAVNVTSPEKLTVIGIGASAGGLGALRAFFA